MKLLDEIKSAEHSTVAYLDKVLTKIEGEEPKIAKLIDAALKYATPALQIALVATNDPAAAAIVGTVSKEAQSDLAVASALVTDFGPTPTAASAFAAVRDNLDGLLTAGHVTSTQGVAAVTKVADEINVIAKLVHSAATAVTGAATPAS